jgi:hypothetical protein
VFNHKQPSFASWKARFKSEVREHLVKIKKELHRSVISSLEAL